ncbi:MULTISPECIES: hypothetical protein [Thalassospira]|uniref:Uncharacterized protein n=1 Tax=Thalassospira profundimaris TaxID=502049 RepID=A0A367V670_9PROT|nr:MULTISPECIES: hypothetical protein [Thalassospira]KZB70599.1 hypothetical protein AUQ43_06880 [Thalassospira sp. MCCC 1A01148]MBR9899724.1 hypothetical protein [Rhodospirillales bacterium]RCK19852.1 hypothetical protein TH6_17735 [Thalassospira profundimaris]
MSNLFDLETKKKAYQFWRVLFVSAAKCSWISLTIIGTVMMSTFIALITSTQSVVQVTYSLNILFYSFVAMVAAVGGHFSLRCYMQAVDEELFTAGYRTWFERFRRSKPILELIPIMILHIVVLGMFVCGILYQIAVFGFAGYAFVTSFSDIRHDFVCDAELTRVLTVSRYEPTEDCVDFVSRHLSDSGL